MTLERVAEILDFYGPDTMLLIGGSLLAARERLTEETAAFARAVAHTAIGEGQMDIEQQTPSRAAALPLGGRRRPPYKEDGAAPFKDISRQVLFAEPKLAASCAISRWRPAAIRRSSGTSTSTR